MYVRTADSTALGNRAKQKRKVAKVHELVANRRHNFIHQVTAKLAVKNHATTIAVENLNIKGMIRNRKLSRAIQGDRIGFTFVLIKTVLNDT